MNGNKPEKEIIRTLDGDEVDAELLDLRFPNQKFATALTPRPMPKNQQDAWLTESPSGCFH